MTVGPASNSHRVVAIVPCKDGEASIGETVAALKAGVSKVLVVDDGSVDATASTAEAAGAEVLRLPDNLGKARALRAGIDHSPDADIYLFVDADTRSSAAQALELLAPVRDDEFDLVIGVLPSAGRKAGFGSVKRFAQWGIRKTTRLDQSAPLSGQRAIRGNLARRINLGSRFGAEVAMTISAHRHSARIKEQPVEMTHQHTGRTVRGFLHRGKQGADVVSSLWSAMLPKWVRFGVFVLTLILVALSLTGLAGSHRDSGQSLGESSGVSVVAIPGWQWANEPGSAPSGAMASVVTGDVDDAVGAIAAGSRDVDADSVLGELEVDVETSEDIAQRGVPISAGPNVVIAVGVGGEGHDPALRPLLITGPNVSGTLVSPSTGRAGLVDIKDIAPTVLALQGKPIPDGLDGEVLQTQPGNAPDLQAFSALDQTSQFYESAKPGVIVGYVVAQTALFLAAWFLHRRNGDIPAWFSTAALAVAGFPCAVYLIRWWTGGSHLGILEWSALTAALVAIIVGVSAAGARNQLHRLQRLMLLLIVVICGDVLTGSYLQTSGIFGTTPLIGTRYFGLGNPATTLLLGAAVVWSALHVRFSADRTAALKRIALLFVGLTVIIGHPGLGADGGGLIGSAFCAVVTLMVLHARRIQWFRSVTALLGAAAVAAVVAFLDQLRPAESQTHLGRFADRVISDPNYVIDTAVRRLDTNFFSYGFPYTLIVVAVAGVFLGALLAGRWTSVAPQGSYVRLAAVLVMVTVFAMFFLNDSGVVVLALGAVFVGPLLLLQSSKSTPLEVET
jgi:hypothetical protein